MTFAACFILVHLIKLAILGIRSARRKPDPPKAEEKPAPEPVYYIVEKKKTRKSYSDPKEIQFKK